VQTPDFAEFTLSGDLSARRHLPFLAHHSTEDGMFGIALRYGIISGAFILGVIVLGIVLSRGHADGGFFSSEYFGYLVMLVALSTIFLAIRDYRNQELGGVIKFLPALGLGLMIAAIAGIAYVIAWEIYLNATNYQFMNHYAAAMTERARAAGLTGAALQAKLAQIEEMREGYANPMIRLPMTFLEIFPVGVLIALISAALLRNPKVAPARA
jgi:hypothetical protein